MVVELARETAPGKRKTKNKGGRLPGGAHPAIMAEAAPAEERKSLTRQASSAMMSLVPKPQRRNSKQRRFSVNKVANMQGLEALQAAEVCRGPRLHAPSSRRGSAASDGPHSPPARPL